MGLQPLRVAVKGSEVRGVHTAPVPQEQGRLRVGGGQAQGVLKADVPLTVGEVEEHQVGGGHVQVLLHQPGVPHRPDGAVRGVQPKAAEVLLPEHPVRRPRCVVLPGVVRRGQGNVHRPDGEFVPNVMPHAVQAQLPAEPRHIPGGVVGPAHRL